VVRTAAGRVVAPGHPGGNGYLGAEAEGLPPGHADQQLHRRDRTPGRRAKDILSEPVAVADTKFVVNYWRLSEDNRLLFGGGESYGYRFPDIVKTVSKPMLEVYPQLKDPDRPMPGAARWRSP
jgi:gamma-glutamylputrescine oxidase